MTSYPPGERDLRMLLASANPTLDPTTYVFATVSDRRLPQDVHPVCTFEEAEGLTLILQRDAAERHGIACTFPCRKLTLGVHSALDAVGFLSAVMSRLAAHGISTNAVSAYYHDHLFVALDRADEAVELLRDLS